jgi:radical SAM superfamily enzyme YgiQ (UPF0313 family)
MPGKLILINPVSDFRRGFAVNALSCYPPLSLGIIASLTPSDWEIRIIDENFEKFQYTEADLVGITAFTPSALRAYQIADEYRKKGVKVVMGGIHASMIPEECENYVDSVVIGEAEGVWAKVIQDFEAGNLQKRYKAEILEFKGWPVPRHDLFHKGYAFDSIQTSRGCPMRCDFCSVSIFNGCTYRQRPIDEVIEELKMIRHKFMFIVDDNILGYGKQFENRAVELFKRMKSENINKDWFSHASLNFANSPEVMKHAAACGCKLIFIGFEAETEEQLQEMNKKMNLKMGAHTYTELTKKINRSRIGVMGGFIMGLDTDTVESVEKRKQYILRSQINIIGTSFLTPFPGTPVFKRLTEENRIVKNNFPEDWKHYDLLDVVYKPKNMTGEQLDKLVMESWKLFYSQRNIIIRSIFTLLRTRSWKITKWVFASNKHYRNVFVKSNIRGM